MGKRGGGGGNQVPTVLHEYKSGCFPAPAPANIGVGNSSMHPYTTDTCCLPIRRYGGSLHKKGVRQTSLHPCSYSSIIYTYPQRPFLMERPSTPSNLNGKKTLKYKKKKLGSSEPSIRLMALVGTHTNEGCPWNASIGRQRSYGLHYPQEYNYLQ